MREGRRMVRRREEEDGGGWMRRDDEEEGAQPRMKLTDSMVIECKYCFLSCIAGRTL